MHEIHLERLFRNRAHGSSFTLSWYSKALASRSLTEHSFTSLTLPKAVDVACGAKHGSLHEPSFPSGSPHTVVSVGSLCGPARQPRRPKSLSATQIPLVYDTVTSQNTQRLERPCRHWSHAQMRQCADRSIRAGLWPVMTIETRPFFCGRSDFSLGMLAAAESKEYPGDDHAMAWIVAVFRPSISTARRRQARRHHSRF